MQSLYCNALNNARRSARLTLRAQYRYISLTGAIERGLRKGQRSLEDKQEPWRSQDRRPARWSRDDDGSSMPPERGSTESFERAPHSLPYTTASSEFIYGVYAINAALRARRRKLHKLYVHGQVNEQDSIGSAALKKRAKDAGVELHKVSGPSWRQLFDRTSEGRPHNGLILEASAVPVLPVIALHNVAEMGDAVSAQVGLLSAEDDAIAQAFGVQSGIAKISARGRRRRYPLVLLLDRVTDLGNLGAILRSAYFFGVDAVVLLDHGTAPLSGVTIKASAGAGELMPILKISNETGFITTSKANGWHFVAAIAPDDTPLLNNRVVIPQHDIDSDSLDKKPTVLMLGNEAEGLRPRIARMSTSTITIEDAVTKDHGIDSLNVSVAAGILMHDLLRPFLGKKLGGR